MRKGQNENLKTMGKSINKHVLEAWVMVNKHIKIYLTLLAMCAMHTKITEYTFPPRKWVKTQTRRKKKWLSCF